MTQSIRHPKLFKSLKLMLGVAAVALILLTTSCSDDDPGSDATLDNIVDIADNTGDLSTLVAALGRFPDLVSTLSDDDGTFTVFAPTNNAFNGLLNATGQTSLDDIPDAVLRRVLEYHVIPGAALASTELSDGSTATTVLGEDVTINKSGNNVSVNGLSVATPDVSAANGIVHIIDGILVPSLEASILNTVVEPAYFNKDFTVLTDAVVKADLLSELIKSTEEFTVFAPTNQAFADAGITSLTGLDKNTLTPILEYHVLDSEVKAADLPATGSAVPTLNGDFYLSKNDNGVFINGSTEVIITDIDQDNGVVHVIDRALDPASKDVVQIAVDASSASQGAEFGQLVAALTAVQNDVNAPNLIDDLKGAGPFTVFAPTDAAFQTLYNEVPDADTDGDKDIDDLVDAAGGLGTIATVLQYHVYDGRVFSADIPNLLNGNMEVTIPTLAGVSWILNSNLSISARDGELSLGLDDAKIVDTDILATNGVVHVVDQVILP